MTTRGPAKESSVGASASTVKPLTYVRDASGKNNYAAWLEEVIDKIGKDFGRVATVLKTHVAYEVPPIAEEDYIPADLPVGMILTEANRRELFLKSFSLRHEKLKALEDESPKFYRAIWATLSEESRALLSAQPGYDGPDGWGARERPNDLLAAIRLTHFTNENAIEGPGMAELNLQMKEAAFANFRQLPGVPISKFKKEFLERVAALEAAGGAVDPEPRKAMKFLNKLDKERHGRMLIRLKNDALRGVAAYPATVEEAYTLAFTWTADDLAGMRTAADGSSIFVLSDDIRPAPNKKPPSQGPPAGASAQRKGSGTGRSGEGGTHSKGDYKPSPEEEAARQAYLKLRTCHGCGKPGHIVRRCPERKRGGGDGPVYATTAVGEDDEADVEGPSCMIRTTTERPDEPVLFFTPTEVVLDNAAGQCVFNNRELVHSAVDMRGKRAGVGGVNKSAEPLPVEAEGLFADVPCKVHVASGSAANLLSQAMLKDSGCGVSYDEVRDRYTITTASRTWCFERKLHADGRKTRYYVRDMADELVTRAMDDEQVFVATVEENLRRVTKREVARARAAVELRTRLGHVSTKGMIDILQGGVTNCPVTPMDVRLADAVFGKSVAAMKGKTKKQKSAISTSVLTGVRRETQVQQTLSLDVMFVKQLAFLVGVLTPLGLCVVQHLKDRTAGCIGPTITRMLKYIKSHHFQVVEVRADGEGGIGAMISELRDMGIKVDPAGPGQHVPVVERMIQTVKSTVRSFEHGLPYVMPRLMLIFCVLYAVRCTNFRPNSNSLDKTSPFEQFTGLKLDAARDLRCGFGDYVQATVPNTDNSMEARTEGCICLLPTGNSTGSVKMWSLGTSEVVTRDQFRILPMTSELCTYITALAEKEGYRRGSDPSFTSSGPASAEDVDNDDANTAPLPDMMPIAGRFEQPAGVHGDGAGIAVAATAPVAGAGVVPADDANPPGGGVDYAELGFGGAFDPGAEMEVVLPPPLRRSARIAGLAPQPPLALLTVDDSLRADLRRLILHTSDWHDPAFAFKITVKSAMRDRPKEALPVILAELKQMLDKGVWHGVRTKNLTSQQRQAIIRSSMFLKDKFLASGAFDKFKARLVAGGDQQDRTLYEDLSSPTAATSSVLVVAAIAAAEGRIVNILDIGGAFLNASMVPTGVKVHMRLDKLMAELLVQLAPEYREFVEPSGCIVVELDKALYGCVEAALLWYNDLSSKLIDFGFEANPYDQCVLNKICKETGVQITVVLHVDDLMITCVSQKMIDEFIAYLNSNYPETKHASGPVVNYVGMTFDFATAGQVRVTMDHCVQDILQGCGEVKVKPTPAASTLFDVRADAAKATEDQKKMFHTQVAKVLYLAKRVRPECLTAVSFLATRVHACDVDDLAKLRRLHGYLKGTPHRGIVLRVGEHMSVTGYIDAAYGVHSDSGKSHTGCAIVIGEMGAVFAKSTKQKIVTKSSTEAELVGLSDTASQAIHLRNFVQSQGYETGPAIIYQDNLSCMALMKRGGPGSERSRHINIRHFWMKEKVDDGEVVVRHLSTERMFANSLTKPVQGAQFAAERHGLTGWA